MPFMSSATPERARDSPARSRVIASSACATSRGGGASRAPGTRRRRRARVAASRPSGSWRAAIPCGVHATPQRPIGVSKSARPGAVMRASYHRGRAARSADLTVRSPALRATGARLGGLLELLDRVPERLRLERPPDRPGDPEADVDRLRAGRRRARAGRLEAVRALHGLEISLDEPPAAAVRRLPRVLEDVVDGLDHVDREGDPAREAVGMSVEGAALLHRA